MEKMLFTEKQLEVTVTILPDGKRDVRILTDEETVSSTGETISPTGETTSENTGDAEEPSEDTMYQYTGNQFRTVYPLSEEDILADKEKYLNYSPDGEPTLEQIQHDQEITDAAIDSYTMELLEGGLL